MIIIDSHIVPDIISKSRLSDYACDLFPAIPSRKGIKKAIKRGAIRINGEPAATGDWVLPGQQIELIAIDQAPTKIFPLQLDIIFEDEFLALIRKPAGYVVSGNQYQTIENALPFNLKKSDLPDALQSPKPVHRLDGPTSGLLLVAKTRTAHTHLAKQFEHKTIEKKYQAIVLGDLPEEGLLNEAIEGKAAETHFKLISKISSLKNGILSLVDLFPKTGRTHQLRIHLSNFGFPILGDKLYGIPGNILKGKGLFLCAYALKFQHPDSKEQLYFEIKAPNKFQAYLNRMAI